MSDHTIMIIWVMKVVFVQFFCVFLPRLLNIFSSVRSIPFLSSVRDQGQQPRELPHAGGQEIVLVQGMEQRLCFAGAAVKKDPASKVRETQVRR